MPKSIRIDPADVRRAAVLRAPDVPLNAYLPDAAAETARWGADALVQVYRDMLFIREFETMLDRVKREGTYEGVEVAHKGPAHLSIGQEAAAVGQALALDVDDFILGSHRSHGEILAKSFRALRQLPEDMLQHVLEHTHEGRTLRAVNTFTTANDVRDRALDFVLYGTLAEIFGRDTGFNRGMGGSMHAFFAPFGVLPNNAIVGGAAPMAVGAALFKRVNRKPGIVIANIGDASSGCGPVWEAMMFAAMDQFRTLWPQEAGGHPPILFNVQNNFYGMGGQPYGETMGFDVLARLGLGVNPEAMHAERVDGYNPLAVADATARKKALLQEGRGPALLDTVTYRFSGHSPSDASSYRERDEVDLWRAQDALVAYGDTLITRGLTDAAALEAMRAETVERLVRVLGAASSEALSPRISVLVDSIGALMFSDGDVPAYDDARPPDVLLPRDETRLSVTHGKLRYGLDDDGTPRPKLKCVTYAEALFEAMLHRFYEDPTMVAYGEENRDWGGAFGVYRGLTEALPYPRLFNTPISEAAIVGTAVGYAISGGRVVAELMYADFIGRAGDEIFNQMAKWQAMSGGTLRMPMVLRVSVGSKYGAQHSQDWSSLIAHIPGLRVMFPATPYDAKGMLSLALRGTDPVVFFESQRLYSEPETLVPGGVPLDDYQVPLGQPVVRRQGADVTIATLGATLYRALAAADTLAAQHGVSAEVVDLRFINPLDDAVLLASVAKTGKLVLASDACDRGSFMHTVASHVTQVAFDQLDGPPVVVGARNWITPPAELEEAFFPQPDWIIDALHERLLPLPGHTPTTVQTVGELRRRNRLGI